MATEIKVTQSTIHEHVNTLETNTQNLDPLSVEHNDNESTMQLIKALNQINISYQQLMTAYKSELNLHIQALEQTVESFVQKDEGLSDQFKLR